MSLLRIDGLTIDAGKHRLLDNVDLDVPLGKICVLVGRSGAGKSVLLRVLASLVPQSGSQRDFTEAIHWSGSVTVDQRDSASSPRIGVVFQQFALFDELTPEENVQFAIDHRCKHDGDPQYTAAEWLELLGVPSGTQVATLSGGQKQRLAIARTLAAEPDIILYDEPTSGLDSATAQTVATLIQETQSRFGRTSIIVTHDYATLLPIADHVMLLDSAARAIHVIDEADQEHVAVRLKEDAEQFQSDSEEAALDEVRGSAHGVGPRHRMDPVRRIDPVRRMTDQLDRFLQSTGGAIVKTVRLPIDAFPRVPRASWAVRFWLHDLWLIAGPSAWAYLIVAGLISGFTTTYFTFKFLPFKLYTQPLLIDELLAAIGFALYRILVPVLATVLIAARCGAAIAADVGVKRYGGQVDAMRTLGVRPQAYLLVPILLAFLLATPLLQWLAFMSAQWISRITFASEYSEMGLHFWQQHFYRRIEPAEIPWVPMILGDGFGWVLLKNLFCGAGTAVIAFHQGFTPKRSASDVSTAITATVLWSTLFVLAVHFVIALLEF